MLLPVDAYIKVAAGVPQLDKISIPNLAALVACIVYAGKVRILKGFGPTELFLLFFVFSPFITSQLNSDVIIFGSTTLPAVGNYDALSAVVAQFLFVIPFFLGRQFLNTPQGTRETLRVLCLAGLFYSPFILLEILLSPQLHYWLYGFYPSSFVQQMREGGFRSMVFMGHGLTLSFFLMTAVLAATALWRAKLSVFKVPSVVTTGFLYWLLLLNKSLAGFVYASFFAPFVRYTSARLQLTVAVSLVTLVLLYPVLRTLDLFPKEALLEVASTVSTERADSLKFRFDNEDQLRDRAWERKWFGWGRFGRSRVYDADGRDISVTDGRWIITLGQFGLIGFIGEFGLLAIPVIAAWRATRRFTQTEDVLFIAALALIVSLNVLDLLPNSWLTPWTWLLAGSLLGRAETFVGNRPRHVVRMDVTNGSRLG